MYILCMTCVILSGLFKVIIHIHTDTYVTQEVSTAPGKNKYTPQEWKFSGQHHSILEAVHSFHSILLPIVYRLKETLSVMHQGQMSQWSHFWKPPPHFFLLLCNFWWDKSRGAKFVSFSNAISFLFLKKIHGEFENSLREDRVRISVFIWLQTQRTYIGGQEKAKNCETSGSQERKSKSTSGFQICYSECSNMQN